jgi:hypothetical protein
MLNYSFVGCPWSWCFVLKLNLPIAIPSLLGVEGASFSPFYLSLTACCGCYQNKLSPVMRIEDKEKPAYLLVYAYIFWTLPIKPKPRWTDSSNTAF